MVSREREKLLIYFKTINIQLTFWTHSEGSPVPALLEIMSHSLDGDNRL